MSDVQLSPGVVQKLNLNTTDTGHAVITRVMTENGISIVSHSGVDDGTGDIVIRADDAYFDAKYWPLNQHDSFANITGKPTTLGGYGITDAIHVNRINAANGVAGLDAGGKIPIELLPSTLLIFKGSWNAVTNTPTLSDGSGTTGHVYMVTGAPTLTSINLGSGAQLVLNGDYLAYNGTAWQQIEGTNSVQSIVNPYGEVKQGIVNLVKRDVGLDNVANVDTTNAGNISSGTLGVARLHSSVVLDTNSYNNPAWITGLGYSKLSGVPTTISGFGITDAYTKTQINAFFSGGTAITGYNSTDWDSAYLWGSHASAGYHKKNIATLVNVNLNDYVSHGSYAVDTTTGSIGNIPTSGNGQLLVFDNSMEVLQYFIPIAGLSMYFRIYRKDTLAWSAWAQTWHSGNLNPGDYALASHTHSFASLTGKPTTIAGYGITDGALNTISISASGSGITGGGTLAANRTIQLDYTFLDARYAAYGIYQPLDGDLTAIASLTTTTFGRSLLTLADVASAPTWNQNTTGTAYNITQYVINQNLGTTNNVVHNAITASNAMYTTANSGAYALYVKGRASDNYAISGFYDNTGVTRYGYIQSHSAYGGTLAIVGDGGTRIDIDSRGLTVNNVINGTTASFSGTVTAPNFTGLASNSTLWAGQGYSSSDQAINTYMMAYGASTGTWYPASTSRIQAFLGYITGNQNITLSGDVSGSGTTAITTTIGALKVTNAMLAGSIDYAKMNAATAPTWNQNTTGNAATATLAANSTLWNSYAVNASVYATSFTQVMVYDNANSRFGVASAAQMASFLSGQTMNIAGYATSETLATTTGRGNTTTTMSWFNGGIGFDQAGVRSWTLSAGSGNLLLSSGDGGGIIGLTATQFSMSGRGMFIKSAQTSYSTAALEVYTADGAASEVGISFHRGGQSAGFLSHGSYGGLRWEGSQLLMANNYNSYAPTLTGGGANGTWGISITGNADGAYKLWSTSHSTSYYLTNTWNGSYWRLASNHSSGVSVEHATLWNGVAINLSSESTAPEYITTFQGGIARYSTASTIRTFLNASVTPTANSLVQRDSNGYVEAVYFKSTNTSVSGSGLVSITGKQSGDGYMYEHNAAAVQSFIGLHNYMLLPGAVTTGGTTDWNHITNAKAGSGYTLLDGAHTNGPGSGGYYHTFNFEYAYKDGTGNLTQIGIPYIAGSGRVVIRSKYGTWGSWRGLVYIDELGSMAYASTGAYLPLTGGTLTGALAGTSAAFSSSVRVGSSASTNLLLGPIALEFLNNGSYSAATIYAQGLTLHNGGANILAVSNTGATTLYNTLTGINANFTGQIQSISEYAINTTTPGTQTYGFHFSGQTTAGYATGITWNGASSGAQAGIYVQGSGAYGTKMYLATTDNFTTGAKTALSIDHSGHIVITRGSLTGSTAIFSSDVLSSTGFVYSNAVSADNTFGLYFDGTKATTYAIYREAGSWTTPYPDLHIGFYTGIKIGADVSYGGIRFYDHSDFGIGNKIFSVGDGDKNIRMPYGGSKLILKNAGSGIEIQALQANYFGYSSSYAVLQIGDTGANRSIAFGVDITGNVSGSFNGGGLEYIWKNVGKFITPNATNNGYNTLFSWNSTGGITLGYHLSTGSWNIDAGAGTINATTFIGALTGNASTATLAANSTLWNTRTLDLATLTSGFTQMLVYDNATGKIMPASVAQMQSTLTLGSYAYRSTGLFEVGGTNAISAVNYYTAPGQYFYSDKGASTYIKNTDSPALQVYSTDSGPAFMSFHRAGIYAVNMGLDINNELVIGGWSVGSAARFNLDLPNGGLTISVGAAMTGGWNRTMVLSSTYPTLVFNSNNTKWAGISYDYSSNMVFRVNATSSDLYGSGMTAMTINTANGNITTINHLTAGGEVQGAGVRSTTNFYTTNYGYGLVGQYSSTKFQGVFSMGSAWALSADGSTTGNLYGLAWSHPDALGQAANLSSHGLLVMINGITQSAISTNIWAGGAITSTAGMYAGTWFYNSGTTGLYNSSNAGYFYNGSAAYWSLTSNNGLIFRGGYETSIKGYIYHDSSGFGLLNSAGSWAVRTVDATNNTLFGDWGVSSALAVTGSVTAASLIKAGGTSSQYLMADGSVKTQGSYGSNTVFARGWDFIPDISASGTTVTIYLPSDIGVTDYAVMITLKDRPTPDANANLGARASAALYAPVVTAKLTDRFSIWFWEPASYTQAGLAFEWVVIN